MTPDFDELVGTDLDPGSASVSSVSTSSSSSRGRHRSLASG